MTDKNIHLLMNVTPVAAGWQSLKESTATFLALIKWRVIALVTFTAMVAGLVATRGTGDHANALGQVFVAGLLAAGGAAALNQYFDRDVDDKMGRTKARPLPAGKMTPFFALVVGAILVTLGLALSWRIGRIVALHVGIAVITYVLIYTIWLKRRTPWNIVIGGWTGSAPLLAAWGAVAPLGLGAWALAGIIFLWTPAHFWSLAICKESEYRRAGIPMLPVVASLRQTVSAIFGGAVTTLLISLVPVFTRDLGWGYLIAALVLGVGFVYSSWQLCRQPTIPTAWKNYKASSYYLLFLFLAMVGDVLWRLWFTA